VLAEKLIAKGEKKKLLQWVLDVFAKYVLWAKERRQRRRKSALTWDCAGGRLSNGSYACPVAIANGVACASQHLWPGKGSSVDLSKQLLGIKRTVVFLQRAIRFYLGRKGDFAAWRAREPIAQRPSKETVLAAFKCGIYSLLF